MLANRISPLCDFLKLCHIKSEFSIYEITEAVSIKKSNFAEDSFHRIMFSFLIFLI